MAGRLPAPRRMTLSVLRDPASGEALDQALVVWMPGPESFTGEDQAELHLHGGLAVRAAVLRTLAGLPGCRAAEPGEFTRRAFLNGRMDLSAVEGLADLIDAETEAQRRQALRQLEGRLGSLVESWRERLIECLALLEAALDFSDEPDVAAGVEEQAVGLGKTWRKNWRATSPRAAAASVCARASRSSSPARRTPESRPFSTPWRAATSPSCRRSPAPPATPSRCAATSVDCL